MIKTLFTPDFGENQYTENTYEALNKIDNISLTVSSAINLKSLSFGINAFDIAIVHWLENTLVNRNKKLSILSICNFFIKFLILKLVAKKIIYVRHNIYPHELSGISATIAKWLTYLCIYFCDKCVVHSGHLASNNIAYVPHPLYLFDDLAQNVKNNYFIVFGRIVEYKVIDQLLNLWGDEQLLIVGKVESKNYLFELNKIIETKKFKNVILDGRYFSQTEAAVKVSSSSGLIISHSDQDMIVSGSFFFASSLGVPVFAVRTPFFDWLIKTYNYPGLFVYDDIETLVQGTSAFNPQNVSREVILESAQNLFGDEVVKQHWKKLLINIE